MDDGFLRRESGGSLSARRIEYHEAWFELRVDMRERWKRMLTDAWDDDHDRVLCEHAIEKETREKEDGEWWTKGVTSDGIPNMQKERRTWTKERRYKR